MEDKTKCPGCRSVPILESTSRRPPVVKAQQSAEPLTGAQAWLSLNLAQELAGLGGKGGSDEYWYPKGVA